MKEKIKIGDRWIGKGESTFIIAEVGSNHNRNLEQAKELIDAAASSGVDAVKFQLFQAEKLYPNKDALYEIMKANELPLEWVGELAEYSEVRGIRFIASPFDEESVDCLYELGVPAFKWASSETVNLPLLRHAGAKHKPMLIATGMCDLADVAAAVEVVNAVGNEDIILLHCTSLYPAQPGQVNLRAMNTMREAFHLPVGLSDHTLGFLVAVAAVARGACVIEKHFTLNREMKGPDHAYALEPGELGQMVAAIRTVAESLGSPIKDMLPEEKEVARRESVTATVNIPKGATLTKDMVAVKRPAFGIKPRFLDAVIGGEAQRDIRAGEPITWDMVL